VKLTDYLFGRENWPGEQEGGPEEYSELPTEEELQTARRELSGYRQLEASLGWELLREQVGKAADEALAKWVAGGLDFQQTERLAARIEAFKWILAMPSARRAEAEYLIEEAARLVRTTQEPEDVLTDPEEGYL
jgi:hypothetical protein